MALTTPKGSKPATLDTAIQWVAHFLLNHGSLAFSGELHVDAGKKNIYIDVSNLDAQQLALVNVAADGACVCASGEERRLFVLEGVSVQSSKDGTKTLRARFPRGITSPPTRKSNRTLLPKGAAQIGIGEQFYDALNLSEGGCAFSCPDAAAKNWPPGHQIECILFAQDRLRLECKITVVRIQHDLAQPPTANALVSCRFSDQKLPMLALAMFD